MPVTSPTSDMYGGHRLGHNLFGQSLVCVRADTGERVWHFQLTHHDLWDYDPPAAPILADITVGGRRINAVIQLTKQSFAYVFDRVTGTPVWPIVERAGAAIVDAGRDRRADAALPHPSGPVRSPGLDDRQPDRLHARAARGSGRDHEAIRHRTAVHAALDPQRCTGRHARHHSAAGLGRRRRLAGRRVRSGDRVALRSVDHHAICRRYRRRRSEAHQPAIHARHAAVDRGATRPAVVQAAVRTDHGDRSEHAAITAGWWRTATAPGIIRRSSTSSCLRSATRAVRRRC